MNLSRIASIAPIATVATVALAFVAMAHASALAQEASGAAVQGPSGATKIAIIDIDRIAAESVAGRALFDSLRGENEKIVTETQRREQEIIDLQTKLNSEILSQDAKVRLQRDIDRKRTDAQRWVEDAQADFEAKRQDGEAKFQEKVAPVVEQVAQENGIGLIFRATPGLTFVLDPTLDISPLIVKKLDELGAEPGEQGAPPPANPQ